MTLLSTLVLLQKGWDVLEGGGCARNYTWSGALLYIALHPCSLSTVWGVASPWAKEGFHAHCWL